MHEPRITINGIELSEGQAMTIRVAVEAFATQLLAEQFPLGMDHHGIAMTANYKRSIEEIRTLENHHG